MAYCGYNKEEVWVAGLSDAVIFASYFSIPVLLASFAAKQDLRVSYFGHDERLRFHLLATLLLFVLFIALCGLTHLVSALSVLTTTVVSSVTLKAMTAVVSLITALYLAKVIPIFLTFFKELELTKRGLPEEILRRHENIYNSSVQLITTHEYSIGGCRIRSVNPACREFGYSRDQLLGRSFFDLIDPADHEAVKRALAYVQEHPYQTMTCEYSLLPRDGGALRVESTFSTSVEECTIFMIITRDMSDRVQREKAERDHERALAENQTRTTYISSIAHDLKTPLATFQLSIDLLLRGSGLSREQRFILDEAAVAIELMNLTVHQALDFARIMDMKKLRPRRAVVSLPHLFKKCRTVLDGYAREVPLHFQLDEKVSAHVMTDGDWVWQMVVNLLTNACKHTVQGYIRLEVTIENAPGYVPPPEPTQGGEGDQAARSNAEGFLPDQAGTALTRGVSLVACHVNSTGGMLTAPPASQPVNAAAAAAAAAPLPPGGQPPLQVELVPCDSSPVKGPFKRSTVVPATPSSAGSPQLVVSTSDSVQAESWGAPQFSQPMSSDQEEEAVLLAHRDRDRDRDASVAGSSTSERLLETTTTKGVGGSGRQQGNNNNYDGAAEGGNGNGKGSSGVPQWRGQLLRFAVRDTGIGVSAERRTELFKPFSQLQARASQGTGLGLYSVMQKAKRLGGDAGVEDNDDPAAGGSGSVFWFSVPYMPEEAPEEDSFFDPAYELDRQRQNSRPVSTNLAEYYTRRSTRRRAGSFIVMSSTGRELLSPGQGWSGSSSGASPAIDSEDDGVGFASQSQPDAGVAGQATTDLRGSMTLPQTIDVSGGEGAAAMRGVLSAGSGSSSSSSGGSIGDTGGGSLSGGPLSGGQAGASPLGGSVKALQAGPVLLPGLAPPAAAKESVSSGSTGGQGSATTSASTDSDEAGSKRVLIVDDTLTVRSLLGRAVSAMGMEPAHAKNGAIALDMLKSSRYLLTLCDLQMPIMDGLECVRRFREWELKTRQGQRRQLILAMSANHEDTDLCRATGMDGFLGKPIRLAVLQQLIKQYVTLADSAQPQAAAAWPIVERPSAVAAAGLPPPFGRQDATTSGTEAAAGQAVRQQGQSKFKFVIFN